MTNKETMPEPWWRQFWPWLLILLPGSVVIAGLVTLKISIQGADSLVRDDYYKEGLGINLRLAQDQTARHLNLSASLEINSNEKMISINLGGDLEPLPHVLLADFIHPNDAKHDFSLSLSRQNTNRYQATLPVDQLSHRWHIQLRDQAALDSGWRLRKTVSVPANASLLTSIDATAQPGQ